MEHQIHFGKKFYHDKKSGYWISTACPKIRAHVWVWKYHHKELEKGFHIHHKDGNKSNNDIENLELLNPRDHVARHSSKERTDRNKIHIEEIRPLTKEWHASKEGAEWHKNHGIKTWVDRKPIQMQCKRCSKSYQTKTFHQEFCCSACKSSWRRATGMDNEERTCPICNNKFTVNKYAKTHTCSRTCGRLLTNSKR